MALHQVQVGAVPGGPAVTVPLPPGTCRRLYLQATGGVTGVTLALLPSGRNTGVPDLVQAFSPAVGLPQSQTSGVPIADDRVWARLTLQGGPTDRIALVVDDGRPCC
jgi:hypothetical protein